jgi:hypothetical protein
MSGCVVSATNLTCEAWSCSARQRRRDSACRADRVDEAPRFGGSPLTLIAASPTRNAVSMLNWPGAKRSGR